MRYLPYFGKGISFPFRINSSTGRVEVSEGSADSSSVALAYLNEDAWTVREETNAKQNLVAEAVSNILLTRQGEHDTLPEYGSNSNAFLFERITPEVKFVLDVYFRQAAVRWEKRVTVPEGAVTFPYPIQRATLGEFAVDVMMQFAEKQPAGNLVAPYVDTRQARLAEYPTASLDQSKHDYDSRYYSHPIDSVDGISFNAPRSKKYIAPANDDYPYRVKYEENWLDIAWSEYQNLEYWWIPANVYVQDAAELGLSWDAMYPAYQIDTGKILRLPSLRRVHAELSTDKFAG